MNCLVGGPLLVGGLGPGPFLNPALARVMVGVRVRVNCSLDYLTLYHNFSSANYLWPSVFRNISIYP